MVSEVYRSREKRIKTEITNLTTAMPVTIIDRVITDMKKRHELLSAIHITDAAGAQRLVMNGIQMASKLGSWGAVTGAISTELKAPLRRLTLQHRNTRLISLSRRIS